MTEQQLDQRPRKFQANKKLLVAIAFFLCAIVAGVSFAVASSPARSDASGAKRTSAPVSAPVAQGTRAGASSVAVDGPTGSGTAIAGTALRWPPGLRGPIERWKAGPGGRALSQVTIQLGTAMQAAGTGLYPVAKQECATLRSNVRAAMVAPPIPYAVIQRLYAGVLTIVARAAAECQDAITVRPQGDEGLTTSLNKTLLRHSLTGLSTASQALYTATAQIRALP